MIFGRVKDRVVTSDEALAGRDYRPYDVPLTHEVLGNPLEGRIPAGYEEIYFGLGCFWGAERKFWRLPGVWTTAVGYQGGSTPNPTYEETCTGRTGHTEAVRVVFDPSVVSLDEVLKTFWTIHDPTQGFRQGNDTGTQYRSAIYYTNEDQLAAIERTRAAYQKAIDEAGYGEITTEVAPAASRPFYLAEAYHQQYLYKNPHGYDCHSTTGVPYPA